MTQLYEQGADVRRIGQYVRDWWRWVRAGVELGVNKLNADSFFCLPSMSIRTHRSFKLIKFSQTYLNRDTMTPSLDLAFFFAAKLFATKT